MRADLAWKKKQRGQAILESIFAFLLLFIMIMGVVEFARIFYIYNQLLTATRMGARYLASHTYTTANRTVARNLILYGQSPAGGKAPLFGLTPDKVQIQPVPAGVDSTNPPRYIIVRATYRVRPFFKGIRWIGLFGSDFDIQPETTVRYLHANL